MVYQARRTGVGGPGGRTWDQSSSGRPISLESSYLTGQPQFSPGPGPRASLNLPGFIRGRPRHARHTRLGGPWGRARDQSSNGRPVSLESSPVSPGPAGPPSGQEIPNRPRPATLQGRTRKTGCRRARQGRCETLSRGWAARAHGTRNRQPAMCLHGSPASQQA